MSLNPNAHRPSNRSRPPDVVEVAFTIVATEFKRFKVSDTLLDLVQRNVDMRNLHFDIRETGRERGKQLIRLLLMSTREVDYSRGAEESVANTEACRSRIKVTPKISPISQTTSIRSFHFHQVTMDNSARYTALMFGAPFRTSRSTSLIK